MEYIVDVLRKNVNDEDVWTAQVNGKKFVARSEDDLREQVRVHLIETVSTLTNKLPDVFQARLKRTWRVRVVEADKKVEDDPDFGWNLFE